MIARYSILLGVSLIFFCVDYTSGTTYTCAASSTCGCSSASQIKVNAKIVGGELADNRAWGWMVSLQRNQAHICGASLITAQYAVTAAHCVNDASTIGQLSILAGTNYLSDLSSSFSQRRSINTVYLNPNYNSATGYNDIAVLQFDSLPTDPSSTLSYICLPPANQDPYTNGTSLVAIGWGVTSAGSDVASDALQQVTLQVVPSSSSDCANVPGSNPAVNFCADVSGGGKDTCQGDSGGPIMAFVNSQWELAGITASGVGCGQAHEPGLYTRVSVFVPFINAAMTGSVSALAVTSTTSSTPTTASTSGSIVSVRSGHERNLRQPLSIMLFLLVVLFFHQ